MTLAYPLKWPLDQRRTEPRKRTRSRYEVSFAHARDDLLHELEVWRARDVVISTNIPLRRDGIPKANYRTPDDPGVAVYWRRRPRPHADLEDVVVACDHYLDVRSNVRAVGLTIEALRAIERAGATEALNKAFTGLQALPATAGATSWRRELGLPDGGVTRADVVAAFRSKVKVAHPDHGGSEAAFQRLVEARDQGLREVSDG